MLMGIREEEQIEAVPLSLWDNKEGNIRYGVNYSNKDED